jgi:hypothetical protein
MSCAPMQSPSGDARCTLKGVHQCITRMFQRIASLHHPCITREEKCQ